MGPQHPLEPSLQKLVRRHKMEEAEFGVRSEESEDASDGDVNDLDFEKRLESAQLDAHNHFRHMHEIDGDLSPKLPARYSNSGGISQSIIGKQQDEVHHEPIDSANRAVVRCIMCKATLPKDRFSKAQLTKHRGKPKCKSCVQVQAA